MSYEFTKLPEVEILESLSDDAHLIVEDEGNTRRFPANQVGKVKTVNGVEPDMDGNIEIPVFDDSYTVKVAIIKDSAYDETVQMMQSELPAPSPTSETDPTFECINMTFEKAYGIMANGEPLIAHIMLLNFNNMPLNIQGNVFFAGIAVFGVPCIVVSTAIDNNYINLFWTADGVSLNPPGGGDS